MYEHSSNRVVTKSGYKRSPEYHFLLFSPDGISHKPEYKGAKDAALDDGIVELKALYKWREVRDINGKLLARKGTKSKMQYSWIEHGDASGFALKTRHAYYMQVQIGMHCKGPQCSWCDLVVYTDNSHLTIRVPRQQEFIVSSLKSLENIYLRRLIPIITNMSYTGVGGSNCVTERRAGEIKRSFVQGKLCSCFRQIIISVVKPCG